MHVNIHHIISDTEKEIYGFTSQYDSWKWTSLTFSNRDDINDIWGDQWSAYYYKQRGEELNALSMKIFGLPFGEVAGSDVMYGHNHHFNEIYAKYSPTIQKTIHGKTRYSARSFATKNDLIPKLTAEEIKQGIVNEVKKMRIVI
jgi:hypothetical protein